MINIKLLASTTSIWENVCGKFGRKNAFIFSPKGEQLRKNHFNMRYRSNRRLELKVSLGWHTSIHTQHKNNYFPERKENPSISPTLMTSSIHGWNAFCFSSELSIHAQACYSLLNYFDFFLGRIIVT